MTFVLAGTPAAGQAPPTLSELLATAVRNNPDVRLARLRIDSAEAERRVARALPNPTLTATPNTPYQYTTTLPLDFGPARVYRTRSSADGSNAARFDQADALRLVRLAVIRGYYDLLLSDALERVAKSQRDVFHQLLVADSARVRAGDAPVRNLVKSELELARSEAELTQAAADVRASRIALQMVIGSAPPDTGFTVCGSLSYRDVPQLDSVSPLAADRPDLKAAEARTAQARSLRSLASVGMVPQPIVNFTYQPGGGTDQTQFWALSSRLVLGLGFSFPLFYWNGGERDRAKAAVSAADLGAVRTRAQVAADIALARDQFAVARQIAQRYEAGLLERARTALDQARYAYRAGAASLLDLLDAIRTDGETQSSYYHAIHDYWVSIAALASALGKELPAQ